MSLISSPSEVVNELERQQRIHDDILRYLTLRVEEMEEGPSVMMQKRDRDDRPRGRFGDRERGPGDRDRGPRRDDRDDSDGDSN